MKKSTKFLVIIVLIGALTFCTTKWLKNYQKYQELKTINNKYLTLKAEIKNYELAIEDYKVAKGEELDNQKKINELNNKIAKLNKEIDNYMTDINRLNKELGNK